MFSKLSLKEGGAARVAGRLLWPVLLVLALAVVGTALAQGGFRGAPGGPPDGGRFPGMPGQPGQPGQGGPGFPGGSEERLELVERFDLDGSGFLEAEERAAAREYLESIGWSGGSRRGGAPGPGGTGAGASAGAEGVSLTPEDVEEYPGLSFYDTDTLRTIFIELGFDEWEAELEAFYNTDVELPATVTIDGVTYENVGLRFRGNTSYSMVQSGLRRPLRLKFDTVVDGQNVEGVRTVKLLNGINDASNLRTVLTSTIMQDYIEVPRVNFVRVVINGESWGVFQSQQNFNCDFLEDWYGESDGVRWEIEGNPNGQGGMLYLGDDPDLYRDVYAIQNRDNQASWDALIELFRVLNETPLENLVEELEPILDIDGVLKYLALDVALVNSDGFWSRASDYELYLDASGKFHMINHDINETLASSSMPGGGGFGGAFGGGFGGAGGVSLDPLVGLSDASSPLRSRLLAVPELQKRYLEIMQDIAERWLDWEGTLGPIAQTYHDLISADMAVDTRSLFSYEEFQASLGTLESFVTERQAYLLGTLPALIERIDVPAYQPATTAETPATESAPAAEQIALQVVAQRDYGVNEGPLGWNVTAGTGAVLDLASGNSVSSVFSFTGLGEGFGASKLDQCVAIDEAQDLSISLSVMAATSTADASGLAVRVNPNFHDSLEACLTALQTDSGSSRLAGGRSDADIDYPFGSASGGVWTLLSPDVMPELAYAAAEIPEGARYLRLSVRARDRSGAEVTPTVLVSEVSVMQGGVELLVNGDFTQ